MKKGFTLIELILIITILGIVAVSALPKFIDVSTQVEETAKKGLVSAIRSGIGLYRAEDLVINGAPGNFPNTLDSANDVVCSEINLCFVTVLATGVSDSHWSKSGLKYMFNDGTSNLTYTYSPETGTFKLPAEEK